MADGGGAGTQIPVPYRVRQVVRELRDTITLALEPMEGEMPLYLPGQFNMLYAFGAGEAAISISGSAAMDGSNVFLHTIRDAGTISGALTRLAPGGMIGLRGPFGSAWPVTVAEGTDVVIVAGGLGLAPLRPAIEAIIKNRWRYGRVAVLIGMRTPGDILYRAEIERWRQSLDIMVEVTVDHADSLWRGHVGVATALLSRVRFDPGTASAFVCGPEVMMRFTANALLAAGMPPEKIYLSMERNMKCAIGLCGHCQFGPHFICKDGPVVPYARIASILSVREI